MGEIIPPDDPALLDTMPHLEPIKAPEHPHLRASNEVQGYRIHTSDGELGEIYDFILEDDNWKIQYLVLKTSRPSVHEAVQNGNVLNWLL